MLSSIDCIDFGPTPTQIGAAWITDMSTTRLLHAHCLIYGINGIAVLRRKYVWNLAALIDQHQHIWLVIRKRLILNRFEH